MIFFKSVMIPCLLLYESYEFGFHTGGRLGLINPERGVTMSYFVVFKHFKESIFLSKYNLSS